MPAYPLYSLRNGQEGIPYVSVLIAETGAIEQAKLFQSSGFVELDNAAMEASEWWRMIPALQGNNPICTWAVVPVTFKLNKSTAEKK